jgi:predicted CXXCH cytochrome family protein
MKINHNRRFRPDAGRMAIVFLLLLIILGMEIPIPRGRAWAAGVELLTPPQGAKVIARNPETHLVLRQSGSGEATRVKVEKSGVMLKPEVNMEGDEHFYLHFRLPLERGLNTFTIIPDGQPLELTYQPLQGLLPVNLKSFSLFHQGDQLPDSCVDCHDLQKTKTIAPAGLTKQTSCADCHKNLIDKKTWLHSTSVNQQCLTCHQQYVKPWRIGFREGRIDETCVACHTGKKDLQSRKHRHGALIGGCTLCHNPHGSKYRYQLWAEGSSQLCLACHDDKQKLFDKDDPVSYVNGIIFGMGCVACHDPHATDNPFVLHKPINQLCVGCHPAFAGIEQGHPVGGHPVAAPKERLRVGRELGCSSCHDPHGSAHQFMLIQTKLGARLCRECHKR